MAIRLTNNSVTLSTSNRTIIYQAPLDVEYAVVFSGTISNISPNKRVEFVTLEHRKGNVYRKIGNEVAVPYGISPVIPKITLLPGEYLYAQASTGNTIDIVVSILVN